KMLARRAATRNTRTAQPTTAATRTEIDFERRLGFASLTGAPRMKARSWARAVSDVAMAVDARRRVRGRCAPAHDVVNEILVAAEAVLLEDRGIAPLDQDRLVEVLKGEAFRMVVPVVRLRDVLAQEVVWKVAVHATCDRMMRGLRPRSILVVHDV